LHVRGSRIAALTALTLAAGSNASAQVKTAASGQTPETGMALGCFLVVVPQPNGARAIPSLRMTIPLQPRFALEAFVSAPQREYDSFYGMYGFQMKQRIVRASSDRIEIFATYGTMGTYDHSPARDYVYTSHDGKPYIEHVASRTEVRMPIIALAGIGAQQRVARRLAVRADAQALVYPFYPGVGVLLSVGVSVPIGRIEKRE
jgi:hypothetical protein